MKKIKSLFSHGDMVKVLFTLLVWTAVITGVITLSTSCTVSKTGIGAELYHPAKVQVVSDSGLIITKGILKDIAFAIDDSEDAYEVLLWDISEGNIPSEIGNVYKNSLEQEIRELKDIHSSLSLQYYNQHESTP
ncbi:MAG: hypothetical protein GOVbin3661_45 [Prokaryotic dsDNA virus sp.]|nr:MAG: hypothetical protein GOVbin3661_45 [Prokaryotic dsDNA virus sp.]|tara:strand:+ start:364 stop:765 length:402 start_codon:yes stop_codon:yes gene_type:complete